MYIVAKSVYSIISGIYGVNHKNVETESQVLLKQSLLKHLQETLYKGEQRSRELIFCFGFQRSSY